MPPSGLPTGTVSSGRDGSPRADATHPSRDTDPETRIAELERENEALRAAVEKQRRENERIVERYEQLLDRDRPAADESERTPPESTGAVVRVARLLGLGGSE
ncbi:hypothetical protein DU504_07725 [Haloplanus salinus]|uniref:Uncharacterized protein n=1 Tax=Haloplanus salinus TaxID=1126245 RepID=A0A368N9J9_9EURY|nr:hypothetical protein [Haloplanus salinus]RCU47198.1 hypothetical protein DU504_07725 [Haloplanus salinus]